MLRFAVAALAVSLLIAAPVRGQLAPAPLPGVGLPGSVPGKLPKLGEAVDSGRVDLRSTRRLAIRELLRRHAKVVDVDPRGEPIVRGQVLAISPSRDALERARTAGFIALRATLLEGFDLSIATLSVPAGLSPRRALKVLRRLDPSGTYDFNHIYTRAGEAGVEFATELREDSGADRAAATRAAKIGLVDGGVSAAHMALDQKRIQRWGCDGRTVPSPHGTAVASLLIGRATGFAGVLPSASLYAADVYCADPTGGNVLTLAAAFSWLAAEGVPVINVSLVGPPDATLERVIARLVARGLLIVAAVGNDGLAAPPLYPAAYPGVIGVTAVDRMNRVLIEAGRGRQVAFAAPGADMIAAADAESFVVVRGTSFAAPLVAGLLAADLARVGQGSDGAQFRLAATALDLGRPGPDEIYGAGLVGEQFRVLPGRLPVQQGKGL